MQYTSEFSVLLHCIVTAQIPPCATLFADLAFCAQRCYSFKGIAFALSHRAMHEGFKQMLIAGRHCMDFILSVNGNDQYYLSASDCVRVAAKLGVRAEQYEIE